MCLHGLREVLAALAEEAAAARPDIPAQATGETEVAGVLVPHTGHEPKRVSRSPG